MTLAVALAACVEPLAPEAEATAARHRLHAQPRVVELVALAEDIPGVQDVTTNRGRRLTALHPYDGRLYIGYGDFFVYDGPLPAVSLDPVTWTFETNSVLRTEEITTFVEHDGWLVTSNVDAAGLQGTGGVFVMDPITRTWTETPHIDDAVHVFEAASFGGALWAVTGLTQDRASVVYSLDAGQSWVSQLVTQGNAVQSIRYYHGRPLVDGGVGGIFVSGVEDPEQGPKDPMAVFCDLGGCTDVSGLPGPAYRLVPMSVGPHHAVLVLGGPPGKTTNYYGSSRLVNGALVPADPFPPDWSPMNWTVAPAAGADAVWLIGGDTATGEAIVAWSHDIASWTTHARLDPALFDATPCAIGVIGDEVYLGTRRGAIYAVR